MKNIENMKNRWLLLIVIVLISHSCKEIPIIEDSDSILLPDNFVYDIFITSDGIKYFATKKGISSFDGTNWVLYHNNLKVTSKNVYSISYYRSLDEQKLWLGTNNGLSEVILPIDASSEVNNFTKENTKPLSVDGSGLTGDSIFVNIIDDKNTLWIGTDGGLSALARNRFLEIKSNSFYDQHFFKNNRITSIDYHGDTLYVGTKGGGVARIVNSSVDAITTASPYEIPWSAIPSNNILSVFTNGSAQWYGTEEGLTMHKGIKAKTNWQSFYEDDGLINNRVQCINKDFEGNMWFGTPAGVSRFRDFEWENYTKEDGLVSNNIQCIAIDIDGSVWFGTDNGVSHFDGTRWVGYKSE